ncbi:MAG: Mini-ribonuclease 3 [Firmicutes bacterium]|nr:Mini-ribonuclease 3 [Bacillota bacterium]
MDKKLGVNFLSASALSFVGDGVHSLFVRSVLAQKHDFKSGQLHKEASRFVSAVAQAKFVESVLDKLTEQEQAIYARCKNAHADQKPKSCSFDQYKRATGLEGVLGWLWLLGEKERVVEIVDWQMSGLQE